MFYYHCYILRVAGEDSGFSNGEGAQKIYGEHEVRSPLYTAESRTRFKALEALGV